MSEQAKKSRRLLRWPSGRTIFIAIVILISLAIILSYVDIPGSIAFVGHFFTAPKHFTYRGHTDYVSSVAWSPDEKRIASASNDGTVQVWNAITGKTIVTFGSQHVTKGFPLPWNTVAWSPDGKRIAVGGNGDVRIWDAASGGNIVTYGYHGGVIHQVAWSPDGHYIAVGFDISVLVWDVATVKNVYIYAGHAGDVFAVAWSPDGRHIASASGDGTVQVWDAFTGNHAYVYRGHADYYPDHYTSGSAVNNVSWSPDGKQIASGSNDATVQVWFAL